jgi:alanine racemase
VDGNGQRARAVVDAGAVERNCATLRARLGDTELCAVVKADGYGHGAAACSAAAVAGGASWLAVATASEAAALRAVQPEVRLLTMGALTPGELELALEVGSDLAAWRPEFLDLISHAAAERGERARVHVKHDSGMGRLGERDPEAVLALVRAVAEDPSLELAGVWTHFATADEPDSEFFDEQLARFRPLVERVKAEHPGCIAHAANSAAVFRDPAAHLDMARCGIAIYGLDPFGESPDARGIEPALSLRSYVADVKRFAAGDSAGYGRSWRARRDTWVGVLPIGYGDGVRRGLTNRGEVLVGGRRHPMAGTISMDNVTIDLGPETDVEPGAPAVLIGRQGDERILAEDVARQLDTINYEVTCGISSRVPRAAAG